MRLGVTIQDTTSTSTTSSSTSPWTPRAGEMCNWVLTPMTPPAPPVRRFLHHSSCLLPAAGFRRHLGNCTSDFLSRGSTRKIPTDPRGLRVAASWTPHTRSTPPSAVNSSTSLRDTAPHIGGSSRPNGEAWLFSHVCSRGGVEISMCAPCLCPA